MFLIFLFYIAIAIDVNSNLVCYTGDIRDQKLVHQALWLATVAHHGQKDKSGVAYIYHPMAVAEMMTTPEEKMVAFLHDVLEDTPVTVEDLVYAGFPGVVVDAVVAMTRLPSEGDAYYARVKANPLALEVKLADIAHNVGRIKNLTDPATRDRLTAKYAHAREMLV